MVYCSKCGTQNADTASNCTNCGAPLYAVGKQYTGSEREHYKRVENECFGLPNGGMIASLIFGIIIVFVGLGLFLQASNVIENFGNYIWPIILIIFGLLVLAGALFSRRKIAHRSP